MKKKATKKKGYKVNKALKSAGLSLHKKLATGKLGTLM